MWCEQTILERYIRTLINRDIFEDMHSRGYYVGHLFRINTNGASSSIFIKMIRQRAMMKINDHVYVQIQLPLAVQ